MSQLIAIFERQAQTVEAIEALRQYLGAWIDQSRLLVVVESDPNNEDIASKPYATTVPLIFISILSNMEPYRSR